MEDRIGNEDIILGGNIRQWLLVSEAVKQKSRQERTDNIEVKELGCFFAGRRVTIKTPSNRYVYDAGSEDGFGRD